MKALHLVKIALLVLVGFAAAKTSKQTPKPTPSFQDDPLFHLRKAWNHVGQWLQQAVINVQTELDKIDWEEVGGKVRQAGDDGMTWPQQVAEEVKARAANFEMQDVNDFIGRTATTLADAIDNLDDSGLGKWIKRASDELGFSETLENLQAVKVEDMPEQLLQYIKDNPKDTAFYVVQGIVYINPSLVSGPALRLLGFTKLGPGAKTVAAALQRKLGAVPAGSWFAKAQSAAMGGRHRVAIDGLFRAGNAAVGVAKWAFGKVVNGTATDREL